MNKLWAKGQLTLGLLLGGALHALSFAPDPLPTWALSPLQLCTMAWLVLCVWRAPSGLYAARHAWFFALGNFAVGLYWLTISMHTYGGMPMPLAMAALLALSAYLALFASVAAWLVHRTYCPARASLTHSTKTLSAVLASLVWASAWTLSEWLRATLFTGFPWLNSGYAHVDSWFAPWASVLGLYGVTFITAFTAAAIAALLLHSGAQAQNKVNNTKHALVGVIALLLALAGLGLRQVNWSTPTGTPLVARIVQGNIDQGLKFTPEYMAQVIQTHLKLASVPTPSASHSPNPSPNVVLLPETALAVFQHHIAPAAWQAWIDLAKHQDTTILMGAALFDLKTRAYTNSVIGLDRHTTVQQLSQGTMSQRYDKSHLVPFGEFVPFGFRWFVNLMSIPLGDFTRGSSGQAPFAVAEQRIAPNICYEDVFGEELLPAVSQAGATVLANFSNLGWFGDSWALRQHWQMSRLRAIETSRPMLRATNTGPSGAIDHQGKSLAQLPALRPGILDVSVQGQLGLTPYTRFGNSLILGFALLVLLGAGWQRRRK